SRPLAFVGSHPMAGSEKSGYRVARVDLFRGALVIVTPTESTDPGGQKRVTDFWEAIGARVTTLDPLTHDRAVAAISHLPHLVADALVDAVLRLDPHYLHVAGPGFRDTTRIAAGSPEVWREIFHDHRQGWGGALGGLGWALEEREGAGAGGDPEALERELDRIKRVRAALA